MHPDFLKILVDPDKRQPLRLVRPEGPGPIASAELRSGDRSYPIIKGIPRFVQAEDAGQRQVGTSFGYKWQKTDLFSSPEACAVIERRLTEKYGFGREQMTAFFAGRRRILDAGCGNGLSSSIWLTDGWSGSAQWVGMDISEAIDAAADRLGHRPNTHFVQADLLAPPFADRTFDTIFSEGVLHHTPSTERALKRTARLLESGGEFLFYVYRVKVPLREFADDHVRREIADLPPERAWEALVPLTRLGQALAELRVEVDVPEDVPLLGIPKGRHDLQRLLYYHFVKLFWNESISFEDNHMVNFDWYHPRYSHRQTEDQVRRWCDEAGLRIDRLYADPSGYTVRATKV